MKHLLLIIATFLCVHTYAQPSEPTLIDTSYLLGFLAAYGTSAQDLVPGGNNYFQDSNCNTAHFAGSVYQRNADSTVTYAGASMQLPPEEYKWYTADSLYILNNDRLYFQTYTTVWDTIQFFPDTVVVADTIPFCDGYLGPHNGMRYHGVQFDHSGATYERYFWGYGQVNNSPQELWSYDGDLYTIMFSYTWLDEYETWGPYEFIIWWENEDYDWDGDWAVTTADLLQVLVYYGTLYEP